MELNDNERSKLRDEGMKQFFKMGLIHNARRRQRIQLKPILENAKTDSTEIFKEDTGQFNYINEIEEENCEVERNLPQEIQTNNLDVISTIIAPTNAYNNEYDSTVKVGDLQETYFKNYKCNDTLPIYSSRDYILNSINSYRVTIIEGATGCGKTTQVPLYILENAILGKPKENPCPIIYVTQPRKIAAQSIAARVCREKNWQLGDIVGYQVGLEKNVGPRTVLCYCTAGVLLQKLITDKKLTKYTHIVVDEAHNRDMDTDLLMMLIRKLMTEEKSFFHLIVMSATMDIEKLRRYYTFRLPYGHEGSSLPGSCRIKDASTPYRTSLHYLDKIRSIFDMSEEMPEIDNEEFRYDEPTITEKCYKVAVRLILKIIPEVDTFNESSKSTLVFLPGLAEIYKLHRLLNAQDPFKTLDIIPLHSTLSNNDQYRVFEPSRTGCRKVILATNIAESSITVKDVGFVIDFCLTKVNVKDPITKFQVLKLQWCTQDQATQRAGRTGRCCKGKVFRLVPTSFFSQLPKYALPEILVAPLELSVLRIKNLYMGELKSLFARLLDPPALREIKTAVLELKQIGALSSTYKGNLSDIDGDITELGKVISALPIDVHLSKLTVIAHILDVLDDAIIIAASLSTNRSVVRYLYGNFIESYINKLDWAKGSNSDLFINLDVYKLYKYHKDERQMNQKWLEAWCATNLLDEKKLNEVSVLVREITTRLDQLGIKSFDRPNMTRDQSEDELMLKIAVCGSFYPNYFLNKDFDIDAVKKALCNYDPTNTVIVSNFPCGYCDLYRDQVLEQITDKVKTDIDFISENSRAMLIIRGTGKELSESKTTGNLIDSKTYQKSTPIDKNVYLALKFADYEKLEIQDETGDSVLNGEIRRLKGPYSPITTTFRAVLEKSTPYSVDVDRSSVNSIILDADYEKKKSQLLVSASVCHGKDNRLVVRDTTLMPRVKGLPTILCLLFAPYYRLKFNNATKSLAGAVFGLGWDLNDEPLCKEYDVSIDFDIQLTKSDIELLNICRTLFSDLLKNIDATKDLRPGRLEKQKELRVAIMEVLRRQRYPIPVPGRYDDGFYEPRNLFTLDRHNVPREELKQLSSGECRTFLPVMEISVNINESQMYQAIRDNLEELGAIRNGEKKAPVKGIRCLLCGNGRTFWFQQYIKIVAHLNSTEHKENLSIFEYFENLVSE